jgi:hypothetical protein
MVGAAVAGLVSFLNKHIGWQPSLLVLPPIYLMYRSYRLYLGKLESGKAARGASFQSAPANHRSARPGHRGQGRNHRRTPAARAHLCHGTGEGTGFERRRNRGAARGFGAARYRKAGGAGTHHFEAGEADAGRIREDEDPSHCWGGDSGAGGFSLSGGADRARASREVGWQRISEWAGRRSKYRSGRAFWPQSIAWTRWLRTANTGRLCRCDEAMAKVASEAGKSFDPRVVAILQRRYVELEKLATEQPLQAPPKLSTDIKVKRGWLRMLGFAESAEPVGTAAGQAADSAGIRISAARQQSRGNHRTQPPEHGDLLGTG